MSETTGMVEFRKSHIFGSKCSYCSKKLKRRNLVKQHTLKSCGIRGVSHIAVVDSH